MDLGKIMTYHIGDKIVYPMHGAGVIAAIEEQEFLGQRRQYYLLKLYGNYGSRGQCRGAGDTGCY